MNDLYRYNVTVSWLEKRKGIMSSDVLDTKIEVATPPEFAHGIPGIWSPEHLFIASAGSCYMTTFLAVAEKSRLAFTSFSCNTSGVLEQKNGKLMITQVTLHPILKVNDTDAVKKGLKVLHLAHESCLILNSLQSEIIFAPHVYY